MRFSLSVKVNSIQYTGDNEDEIMEFLKKNDFERPLFSCDPYTWLVIDGDQLLLLDEDEYENFLDSLWK